MSAEDAFVSSAGDFVFVDVYIGFLGGIKTGLTEAFPDTFRVGEFEEGAEDPDRDNGRDSFSAKITICHFSYLLRMVAVPLLLS